jgi:hypothetical protein
VKCTKAFISISCHCNCAGDGKGSTGAGAPAFFVWAQSVVATKKLRQMADNIFKWFIPVELIKMVSLKEFEKPRLQLLLPLIDVLLTKCNSPAAFLQRLC